MNTIPGLVIDVERRRPALGFGTGGVSGTALLPVGVLATWRVRRAVKAPIIGIGGVSHGRGRAAVPASPARRSSASGPPMLRDPRAPERIVRELARWCERHGVARIADIVGTLEWPA